MSTGGFFNIALPELPTNTDPEVEPDLRDSFNAIKNLATGVSQQGGFEVPLPQYRNVANADYTIGTYRRRLYVPATEAIDYGEVVNVFNNAGTLNCRLANASTSAKPAFGVNYTPGTCAIGDTIEIVLPEAYIDNIGTLVKGTVYYLSTTAGHIQSAPPAAPGNIVQVIGTALDTSKLFLNLSPAYKGVNGYNTYVGGVTASGGGWVNGNAVLDCDYTLVDNMVQARCAISIGNTTALGIGTYTFALPFTAVTPATPTTSFFSGAAIIVDANTGNNYPATAIVSNTQSAATIYAGGAAPLGAAAPFALAANWIILFNLAYTIS